MKARLLMIGAAARQCRSVMFGPVDANAAFAVSFFAAGIAKHAVAEDAVRRMYW